MPAVPASVAFALGTGVVGVATLATFVLLAAGGRDHPPATASTTGDKTPGPRRAD